MDKYSQSQALFQRLFKDHFVRLPDPWQTFHTAIGEHQFDGEAEVLRGSNFITTFLAFLLRLPPASEVPVKLVIQKKREGETWARHFGDHFFQTYLFLGEETKNSDGQFLLRERFGPFCFGIALTAHSETVEWRIDRWWFFGVPLPKFLAPLSQTKEFIDDKGRYAFDIDLSVPLFGRLIAYRGWLNVG
jgi:hypothetical protein